jgi:hypothetical protein
MLAPSPGDRPTPVQPCPYCRLYPLIDGSCERCGTLCGRCGTPYGGSYCPRCNGGEGAEDEEWPQAATGSHVSVPYGDSAPSRSDLGKIIDHYASVKEHNIARGIHVDALEKAAHDKASAAAEQLDVSQEMRTKIMEGVEREAAALWKRSRKGGNSDGGRGIALEKAVALAFLGQCRGIGRSVEEMQRALAKAGFGIRLESVSVTVSSENPTSLGLSVNGREIGPKIAASPKTVRVPLYLSDLLEGEGGMGVVEIRAEGTGAIIDVRSPYEFERPDWQTVKVFAGRRCFYLFKAQKEATTMARAGVAATSAAQVNVEALIKRYLPSKFPLTATLMENAGCLRRVEVRFASLLREMVKDARGRAPESVAASALYLADMDVFSSLSPQVKSLAWSSIVRRGLARGNYLGSKGLLLKTEVGFDESVVQKEDFGRIGGSVS